MKGVCGAHCAGGEFFEKCILFFTIYNNNLVNFLLYIDFQVLN